MECALCMLLPKDCFFAPMGDICNTCLVSMTFNPFIFDGLGWAGRARPGWALTILLCMGSRWAGLDWDFAARGKHCYMD